MYFIAITGCFALFYNEMLVWDDPAKRMQLHDNIAPIDAKFDAWMRSHDATGKITFARLDVPRVGHPVYTSLVGVQADGEPVVFKRAAWDARSGVEIPVRGEGAVHWLYNLHRDLNWPESLGGRRIGRALAGLAGVILLLSIISGILIHAKIFKEIFTMRFYRSVRLRWQDAHKVIGVWGIPPFLMFALTGAYLGIITLLAPATAFLTLNGDQDKLIEAVAGKPAEAAGIAAQMLPVSKLAQRRYDGDEGLSPFFMTFRNWGDINAEVDIYYRVEDDLLLYQQQTHSGITGDIIASAGSVLSQPRLPFSLVAAYSPLHYGTYGGLALKFLYLSIGLMLSVMTALGLMLWVERRLHGSTGKRSKAYYRLISRLLVGALMGVPLAAVACLGFDRLYTGIEAARFAAVGQCYFIALAGSVLYALIRRDDYRATRELLCMTGLGFLWVAFLDSVISGSSLSAAFGPNNTSATVADLVMLLLGLVLIGISTRLPGKRSQHLQADQLEDAAPVATDMVSEPTPAE